VQVLKWFQDKGFKQGTIVTGSNSKRGVVLYDPSQRGFERRIAVGEIASKSREEVISFPSGLLLSQKDK